MAEQIDHHDTSGNLPLHLQYIVNGLNKIIEHLKRSPKGNGALSELVGVIEKTCSPQTNNMFLGPPGLKHLKKEVNLKKILKKFEPLLRVTCTKAELKPDKTNTAQEVVEEFFHLAVADVALLVYSGIHDVHDLHSKITSSDSPVFITMGCNFQEFMASLHSQKCFFNIPSDYDIFLGDGEFVENDRVPSLPEPSSECFHSSQAEKHPVDSSKTDIHKAPSFGNDSLASGVDTVDTTPAHGCPSLSLLSNAGKLQTENENVIGDYDTLASRNQSAVGVAEETSTSWHWESRLFSKVNTHQTHQGTTGMRYGGSTECTVTIVKETGYFDKLLMEKLSAYMRPIIGISCSHGWLLVHFWEGESYAIDLCALSPGTKQDLAFAGTKVAGGTPDNIHKWAIIHSMGRVLSENSILKVVFDALDLSRNLEENAGLKVVRVFDIMEADRIIRGHSSVMPLQEVLQVYGIMPYSSVDIVTGSQRVPVSDDLVDYCGKSQRQAISYLRKMAQVFSRMIPFLYQSVLSIMSAPMLTELNQRSNATVQSPQQSDYWYNPRERSRISEPVKLPTHPCAPKVKESQPSSAASNGKKKQQENKLDNRVKPKATNQTASSVVTVTVTNALQMDEQQKQLQGSTQPPSVKKKEKKKKKESIEKQSPPELRSSRSQDLVNPGGAIQKEQNRMPQQKLQNDVKPKKSSVTSASGQAKPQEQTSSTKSPEGAVGKEKNQLKVKVHNDVVLKESRGLEACGPAKTKEDTNQSKSLHSSKEKGKNQMSQLDMQYNVKAKDTNQTASSVVTVTVTNALQMDEQQKQLQGSSQPPSVKKKKKKKKKESIEKQSPPELRSSRSQDLVNPGGAIQKEQNRMPQQKLQNDVKPKKSSVTSASGQVKPQEQTSSTKSPEGAVGKEKNQLKVKVHNDVVLKESRGLEACGPAKTKEDTNQSKSLHSSKEKGKNQMSQLDMQYDVKAKDTTLNVASVPGKAMDVDVKKERSRMPQQKKQNGVKPKNENLTSASVPAQIQERSSSSKSHLNPGAANENKQNQMPQQKMQNDLKPKKSSVTSASVPAKIQEKNSSSKCHLNPGAASKNEQKQMPQPKVQNDKKPPQNSEIGASGLPKTKDQNNSPKSPHIPREVVKKEQNQVSFERLLNDVTSTKSGITSASGPGKSTDHQPKQEKHQKKQQESSKVKDSVKAESKKKMKEFEEPALRTEKEYSKSEVSHHQQQPTPQRDSPAKKQESDANPTSKHQQMQQKNSKVKDSVKVELKKKEFDNPALRTEKEHTKSDISHHQQPTLHIDSPDEEKESDASPTSVSFTEESGKLEKKSCQDQDPIRTNKKDTRKENTLEQLFHVDKDQGVTDFMTSFELGHIPQQQMQQKQNLKQNIPADEVEKRPQNQPYQQSDLASNKGDQYQNIEVTKQHFQDTHLYQELPSLPKQWPQQQEQSQEQQDQQLLSQLIEDQNISGVPNRDVLSGNQNTDASNVQAKDTLVQQQFYQPQNQQQQNTNVQQQYYQTHQQQEQNLPQQPQNTHLQQQMHLQQHQPTQIDQQPQQLTQHAFLQNTHPHKEVLGSPLLQNQHVPVSGHQATGPLWLTPSNPVNTRVMPNLGLPNPGLPNPAPGIIRQIPLGVVIQAPALPGQQGTTFLQWEQPFRRQVKTSPEAKMSTIPQWMKPMVLQFDEDNYPVFIHPLSEQASIPINPCDITDEQDEQFDDLAISDVTTFVEAFPENFQFALQQLSLESCSYSYVHLVELVMDVGRKPKALYLKSGFSSELTEKVLNHSNLTKQDLDDILKDNSFFRTCDSQAMIRDTLHRLGLLTNAHGEVIGMTAKVEHPFPGCLSPLYDVFNKDKSILVVGPTGVGKTTLLREAARVLSDLEEKSVFVIDTLSEIAGEGDIPHQSIGSARRLQVTECNLQHKIMKEAYQNHRPEIVIVDEIRSLEDAKASLNLRLKGIKLIAGVQGLTLTDVLLNTALTPICGGIKESSIVGNQGGKTVRLRTGPAVFDILVEMLERGRWIIHWDFAWAIDALLPGGSRTVGVEERKVVKCKGDDSGLVSQQVLAMQMPASYTIYTQ